MDCLGKFLLKTTKGFVIFLSKEKRSEEGETLNRKMIAKLKKNSFLFKDAILILQADI
jgi:hypothetical protein